MLFDKDGTLFSFQDTWASWAAELLEELAEGDPDLKDDLARRIKLDLNICKFEADSPAIAGTVDDVMQHLRAALPDMATADLTRLILERSEDVAPVEAVPLKPLLARLRGAGLVLGVATNDGEAAARAQLARLGVVEQFTFLAGYDSGFGGKPEPGMCRAFCELAGVDPGAALMVGDSTHDLLAGRAAGMETLAVLTGPATAEDLRPHADTILADIGRLPEFLGL